MTARRPPIELFETTFQNPILLAAGTAGFGRELEGVVALDRLGGVITKSVSAEPRAGHPAPRVAEFAGGMVNSIGLANPGVLAVQEVELPWLATHAGRARVIVSVVGATVAEYVSVMTVLAGEEIVTAFELNLSCPNTERGGEHFGADDRVLDDLIAQCRHASTRPIIAKLAPTLPDLARTARVAADAGADAISVVNTFPGSLFSAKFGRTDPLPLLGSGSGSVQGGVSGPALLPMGIEATRRVREATGLPVIGVGGIRRPADVRQYLDAGATLVAVGTAALADPRVPERLAEAWTRG